MHGYLFNRRLEAAKQRDASGQGHTHSLGARKQLSSQVSQVQVLLLKRRRSAGGCRNFQSKVQKKENRFSGG